MARNLTKGTRLASESSRLRRKLAALAALAALALALTSGVAEAAQYPPNPEGEDIAFVQLGAVGELVAQQLYSSAASSDALEARERKMFKRLAAQKDNAWRKLNALLGEEATTEGVFDVTIPAKVLRSRGATIALAVRFERLLSGLYLGGVQSTVDPPTRLLIGRELAASTRNLTLLRTLRGPGANLRPVKPLSVEYVGIQFDRYLGLLGG
jgi:hypothetical protein